MLPSVSVPNETAESSQKRPQPSRRSSRTGCDRAHRDCSSDRHAGPTADRFEGAEIRPFRQVGFAENDRAAGAQVRGDGRVLQGRSSEQRERSRGGLHLVAGVDVVLEQDRDAMQRPQHLTLPAQIVRGRANVIASGLSSISELTPWSGPRWSSALMRAM